MSLNPSFLEWLLSAQTPSIRYFTLSSLMGCPEQEAGVVAAREAIENEHPAAKILAGQGENGRWSHEKSYYTPKFTSTHWSMLLLAEIGVEGRNAHYQKGAQAMLDTTAAERHRNLERKKTDIACFYGNMLRYALPAVEIENNHIDEMVHFLIHSLLEGSCSCEHNDGLACGWGVVRALWGLAAVPLERRSKDWQAAVGSGVRFLLEEYSLLKADYPQPALGKIHPLWSRLSFPLFYQADILFTLRVLGELGALQHPAAAPALEWLERRQRPEGRWHGSSPFRHRTWNVLSDQEEVNRWVSLQAAIVLQKASRK